MQKVGNIIFWVAFGALTFLLLFKLYNRYKPNVDLKQVPQQEAHAERNGRQDSNAGAANPQPSNEGETDRQDNSENGNAEDDKYEQYKAPDFTLEDINGNQMKLSDYRGKIVILNFWAEWCPYCVMEMPDLEAAHAELSKGDDAVILTINVEDDADTVKKFIKDRNLTLPVLMDYDGEVSRMYWVNAYPTTFVINRNGSYYGYHQGPLTKEQVLNVVERIKKEEMQQ